MMAKRAGGGSVNVQGRLSVTEAAELDRAAESQPIPVTRAALVSHILRKWLEDRRAGQNSPKGRKPAI